MKKLTVTLAFTACLLSAAAQNVRSRTFCNPINLDYTYMIYNSDKDISYRSGSTCLPNEGHKQQIRAEEKVNFSSFFCISKNLSYFCSCIPTDRFLS